MDPQLIKTNANIHFESANDVQDLIDVLKEAGVPYFKIKFPSSTLQVTGNRQKVQTITEVIYEDSQVKRVTQQETIVKNGGRAIPEQLEFKIPQEGEELNPDMEVPEDVTVQ